MSRAELSGLALAALPRMARLIGARPPVSRIMLERRLSLLPDPERAEIERLEAGLSWERAQRLGDEAAALNEARALLADLETPFVRALAADRLALRAMAAALRRRAAGGEAEAVQGLDLCRYAVRIRRNWTREDFGLARAEPWIAPAAAHLKAQNAKALEGVLLAEAWRRAARAAPRARSAYEAIVVYVLLWSLAQRKSREDGAAARARFARWVDALSRESGLGQGSVP